MDINSVSNYSGSVTQPATATKNVAKETSTETAKENAAVVYERSNTDATTSTKKPYTANTELVNKLKADAQERTSQLQSLVDTLITKQGSSYANANAFTSDFWKNFAANGGTVDEAAVNQAKEDISEDGYWGVKQTSSRIMDFAKALCGGDPDKIDEMEKAFEKGYKQATKSWGDALPSLCSDTYDAVKEGFSQWRKDAEAEAADTTK